MTSSGLLWAGVVLLGAIPVSVERLAGPDLAGTLESLTSEEIVLQASGGGERVPVAAVLALVPQRAVEVPLDEFPLDGPSARVELIDGSQLVAVGYEVSQGKARVTLPGGRTAELPARSVLAVLLARQDDSLRKQWQEIRAVKAAQDVIVIRKAPADGAAAAPRFTLDYLEGVLHDVSPLAVTFQFDGDKIDVRREKVEGLIYYQPAGRELAAAVARVSDSTGSSWNALSLALVGDELRVATPAGATVAIPLAHLVKIDYSVGKVVTLADLEPETIEWTPYLAIGLTPPSLARLYQPRRGRGFDGQPLRLRAVEGEARPPDCSDGLAIHSRTLLVYRLPGEYRRFTALVGIDQSVADEGSVRLEISGDQNKLLDRVVSGADGTISLDLDVTGVRRLKILVDFGEGLDIKDHLDLCKARVWK
jgi:hypothetical protein